MAALLRRGPGKGDDSLGAIQRPNLRFVIDIQHDRPLRWLQVRADHIPQLLDEQLWVDRLRLSVRCGLSPNARQIRPAVWGNTPTD